MTTKRRLGVWMDHSTVHLMEFTDNTNETKTIKQELEKDAEDFQTKEKKKIEANKKQDKYEKFNKNLADILKNYDEVVLFGPIDAKAELYNTLLAEHSFAKTKVEIKQTDRMTEEGQHLFVKEHFSQQKFRPIQKYITN